MSEQGTTSAERDALIAAVVQEYAAVLARERASARGGLQTLDPLCGYAARCQAQGARVALRRVADRLGVVDLHARAADVVARGTEEEGP